MSWITSNDLFFNIVNARSYWTVELRVESGINFSIYIDRISTKNLFVWPNTKCGSFIEPPAARAHYYFETEKLPNACMKFNFEDDIWSHDKGAGVAYSRQLMRDATLQLFISDHEFTSCICVHLHLVPLFLMYVIRKIALLHNLQT